MNKYQESKLLIPILRKYVGIKMFSKEQEAFKEEFFYALFEPYEPVDYSRRSTLFINAVLEEDNIPFIFSEEMDVENGLEGEPYWWLIDLDTL